MRGPYQDRSSGMQNLRAQGYFTGTGPSGFADFSQGACAFYVSPDPRGVERSCKIGDVLQEPWQMWVSVFESRTSKGVTCVDRRRLRRM
eukprot:4702175-Pyramimonas_sp.AAC.1